MEISYSQPWISQDITRTPIDSLSNVWDQSRAWSLSGQLIRHRAADSVLARMREERLFAIWQLHCSKRQAIHSEFAQLVGWLSPFVRIWIHFFLYCRHRWCYRFLHVSINASNHYFLFENNSNCGRKIQRIMNISGRQFAASHTSSALRESNGKTEAIAVDTDSTPHFPIQLFILAARSLLLFLSTARTYILPRASL